MANGKQKFIIKVNELLIDNFGIPPRNKKLPDPVEMLIATILSQNTNDRNSFQAYQNLKNKFSNWTEILKTQRSIIEKEIKVAGLGKQKSEAIKNFVKELYEKEGKLTLKYLDKIENENAIKNLTSYKGVGVKTASCVLLFAMDRNVCPVDTHVHRTVNRIGILKASSPDKTFFALNENFPEKIAHSFHTNLIRLGREICLSQKPNCGVCPLLKICKYEDKVFDKKTLQKERAFMLLDNIS
ncbi:MAG: endonuclease III [Ignavibacteria bacterium GWB2_35_6b]|nr:MAG: endonuclease III [Ignavibacteria bacterium GWB2_35_6b]